MSDSTVTRLGSSSGNYDRLDRLADEFAERYPARRAAEPERVRRPVSGTGRRHPRALPAMVDLEQAEEVRKEGAEAEAALEPPRLRAGPLAGGRLPHPPRDRPRRHGRRLRGRTGFPRPPRGAEDAAAKHRARRQGCSSDSAARRARRPGCTIRTSCRCSRSAARATSATTPCSSSRARALTWSMTRFAACAAGARARG